MEVSTGVGFGDVLGFRRGKGFDCVGVLFEVGWWRRGVLTGWGFFIKVGMAMGEGGLGFMRFGDGEGVGASMVVGWGGGSGGGLGVKGRRGILVVVGKVVVRWERGGERKGREREKKKIIF